MPLDGVFVNAIVKELSTIINGKIDKIHQPSDYENILLVKKDKKNYKILLCANPSYPRVHITENNYENPAAPPPFCMALRKHLNGAKIIDIYQVNFDRIIEFKIEGRDELGYPIIYFLIVEIMGKHSNIILLNEKRYIIDSIKRIGSDVNRYRQIIPGVEYISPPIGEKENPLEQSEENIKNLISNFNSDKPVYKLFTDNFLGISRTLSYEICNNLANIKIKDLSNEQKNLLNINFLYFMAKIRSNDYKYIIFYEETSMFDYYVFELREYKNLKFELYESPSKVLDAFYGQRDLKDSLKQKYTSLFKLITNFIERADKKIQIYRDKIDECNNFDIYKIYGDILMANQYYIDLSSDKVELQNFYDPELKNIIIPIDTELSPVQNAQNYYKRYNKEKNTLEITNKLLKESIEEKQYLESILCNLENASDIDTIEEIKSELFELGYIKKKKNNIKQKKSQPHHFKSSDGFDIYVGKNNYQNDYLTMKFAVGSDIWMHVKNIPGSHVIIKSKNGEVSDAALLEGALLAAFFSKAKNSSNVPVDYTEKKNVKKPSGAKPGMVIYYTNKTIYVTPNENKIKNIISLT
ncbi:MAG: NFACT family protein [Caloramator sp.]|nr:NFACT family protein [Caloramator sp.]